MEKSWLLDIQHSVENHRKMLKPESGVVTVNPMTQSSMDRQVSGFINGMSRSMSGEGVYQVLSEVESLLSYLLDVLFKDGKWKPPGKMAIFKWMGIGKEIIKHVKKIGKIINQNRKA